MDDRRDRDCMDRIERLHERAERLWARLDAFDRCRYQGRYVLVLEMDDFEFLLDPGHFWGPPRVVVRRGSGEAEAWLYEEGVELTRPSRFGRFAERRALDLVRDHAEELRDAWFRVREDDKRGRLGRNLLVD